MRFGGRMTWMGAAVVMVGAFGISACGSMPPSTRTAVIHDVNVGETLSNPELTMNPGDEVRWINLRKSSVLVEIPNLKSGDLTCERGFSGWMGSVRESVELDTNETASLCFKKAGVFNYNVRADTALAGGKRIFPGVITIGPGSTK